MPIHSLLRARIIAFPMGGSSRRWCFHAMTPTTADEIGRPAPDISFMGIIRHVAAVRDLREKGKALTEVLQAKASSEWEELQAAAEGTWKYRLHMLLKRLLSRQHPAEVMLRSVPRNAPEIELIYPSGLDPKLVRRRLRHLAASNLIQQRYWFYANVATLPLTSLATVLPGPNVFLMYNAYRCLARWQAWKGCEAILRMVLSASPSLVLTSSADALARAARTIEAQSPLPLASGEPRLTQAQPMHARQQAQQASTPPQQAQHHQPAKPPHQQAQQHQEGASLQQAQAAEEPPPSSASAAAVTGASPGTGDASKKMEGVLESVARREGVTGGQGVEDARSEVAADASTRASSSSPSADANEGVTAPPEEDEVDAGNPEGDSMATPVVWLPQHVQLILTPCDMLETLTCSEPGTPLLAPVPKPLLEEQVMRICQYLHLDVDEAMKWQDPKYYTRRW